MSADLPQSLAFDDVVIDFAGHRLLRAGEVQALEPKAFAVLALLSGAPGQAFSRDEILDAVWGHRHITPGVLNRVMTMLRHALGEDAHTPRYLHTLHGMGYRFDLPDTAARPPAPDAATGRRRGEAERRAAAASDVPSPASTTAWPRRRWLLAGLGALLVAVLLAGWWSRRDPAPPPAPAATSTSTPTLIVMPLKPIGGIADRDLAAGLSDELISALARVDGLRVIARESTGLAAAQSATLAALVPRLGISHGLEGNLRQSGERLRIHLRLIEARSGRTLWAQDYDRDAADVLALQREIAQAVAAALTLKLGLGFGPTRKGGDAEFLRRYFAAMALFNVRHGDSEAIDQAEIEFRALTRLRPDDARVHAGLARALEARAFRNPPLATELRTEAAQEAALAQRLDPTLPDPYRVQAAGACRANRWEQCLGLLERVHESAPSDSHARSQFAGALAALGYLDQAENVMREGVERDPISPGWRFSYGRILDTLGRHEEARAQLALSDGLNRYALWFNAVWRRDYAEAARVAEALGDSTHSSNDRLYRPAYVATTQALLDPARWPQAEAAMRTTEDQTGLMNFLRVLVPRPNAAELIAGLDVVRERSYSSWDLLLWTKDLAYLRRDPAFQDYLRDNGILDYWRRHGFPKQCRPQGAGAVCA
jgi:TolB-like protein/DNA-binding winged helix-turn-helix (wHTH) protein